MIKLSQDNKSLSYADTDPKNKLVAFLKGRRVIPFKEVKGFLYGAVSETFEHKRRVVVSAMLFNKSLVENTHLLKRSKRSSLEQKDHEERKQETKVGNAMIKLSRTQIFDRFKTMKLSHY